MIRIAWTISACVVCVSAFASPFRHLNGLPDDELRRSAVVMTDVSRVTSESLEAAFRSPLRVKLTAEMLRTPGDPRPYRRGVHQGTDFYGVPKNAPVYPIAPGVIVRTDAVYHPMSKALRAELLARCRAVNGTPGEQGVPLDPRHGDILDRLRGRQVWVYHGRNAAGLPVLSVYAHLNRVGPLGVGSTVTTEDAIGYVGNSGTSQEGVSDGEMHLHLELYVGDEYWSPRRADERGRKLSPARETELRQTILRAFRP